MSDYKFLHNPHSRQWVILAPRRAKRPDQSNNAKILCPFCPAETNQEKEVYRVGGELGDANWLVRVLENKFPFAPIHEVIVHSPDHHKNFEELSLKQVVRILEVYRERYNYHRNSGNVTIFHNHGEASGESLEHPHSQLVVTPATVDLQVPPIDSIEESGTQETAHFRLFCPLTSQWPDEVWIAPKEANTRFGETLEEELEDLAFTLQRLIQILTIRHGNEFPYNFYISPWKHWYLRLIPRQKRIGGFELATNVYVNTQDPRETMEFIQEHFEHPDSQKIIEKHLAKYHRGV